MAKRSPEERARVVLSVLRGELSATEAALRARVAERTVRTWQQAFVEGGQERLALGGRRRSARELELEAEIEELQAALGEVHVQLRKWKKGAAEAPASV